MMDTYETGAEADADRAPQLAMLSALNAAGRALRRDECGAFCINGERGTIHAWGDGKTWVLYVACRSAAGWTRTKQRLAFCQPTQTAKPRVVSGCISVRRQSRRL